MDKDKGKASGDENGGWWEKWRPHTRGIRAALLAAAADQEIRDLLAACLSEYASYIGSGSGEEVLTALTGRGHSSLEAAFLWLGGWRPTAAIVLVYSIMGVQINEETQQPALGPQLFQCVPLLSERQLSRINTLQIQSRRAEADISDRLAVIQMLIPDDDLVAALDLGGATVGGSRDIPQATQLVDAKLASIRGLLMEGDQLRLQTLQELFLLLSPVQGARCCLAGYELVFALKTLGSSAFSQIEVPVVPPPAIPVPVPVIVSGASTSTQALLPQTLPILVPLEPEPSLSLPPLSPIPIPLILPPLEPPLTQLRSVASVAEALNAYSAVDQQQTSIPEVSPSLRQSEGMIHPVAFDPREEFSASAPPACRAQASEVSAAASVCSSIPCPEPVILTTTVFQSEEGSFTTGTEDLPRQSTRSAGTARVPEDERLPDLASTPTSYGDAASASPRPETLPSAAGPVDIYARSEMQGAGEQLALAEQVASMSLSGPTADLVSSSPRSNRPGDNECN